MNVRSYSDPKNASTGWLEGTPTPGTQKSMINDRAADGITSARAVSGSSSPRETLRDVRAPRSAHYVREHRDDGAGAPTRAEVSPRLTPAQASSVRALPDRSAHTGCR